MAIFQYTVANKEGKKLSGTVEAPDEKIARSELNNLGFSILLLQQTTKQPEVDSKFTKFVFESLDKNSRKINGTIPASNIEEAYKKLWHEYNVTVTAIWEQNASPEEIESARKKGAEKLRTELSKTEFPTTETQLEEIKKQQITKTKIEQILFEVNTLLQKFDNEITPIEKSEIDKRINKLLRIKNSTNLEYILKEAQELLMFIQSQDKKLKETGHEEKRFELRMETQKLLDELKIQNKNKTLSEDVIGRIQDWQNSHIVKASRIGISTKLINQILTTIRNWFTTPPEILNIKNLIKTYNKQLWEFIQLYLKEPTPEYKKRVKESIRTVWKARKDAKQKLKEVKLSLKKQRSSINNFLQELNTLSGWLLSFYIIFYLVGLYLTTRDFGLQYIPPAFFIYQTRLFKHILVILFLLHISTALKLNFFKKSLIADIIIVPFFFFGSITVILNF